ncbi:RHS repeat-associated core domain-containing protein [Streptomyces sp. NPDC047725]|uniref:RHS repeat-associated core domain-containing protein n=1 Tax=Streptomyces sp. NPDC047725 TaxID=3365487 RepID=UPI00371F65DE
MRLYNPATGRFLSADPVPGGSCDAYDYACADPVNSDDLTGCATCRVPKHAWTGRSFTAVLRTTRWTYVDLRQLAELQLPLGVGHRER